MDGSLTLLNNARLFVNNINPLITRGDISINGSLIIDGSLNVNGVLSSLNGPVTTSDDRLKHNEEVIANALLTIRQLSPQIYQKTATFRDPHYMGPLNEPYIIEAGLIAQEVEKIDELKFSVTSGNENTPYSLNYNSIFIYCLAALKELDTNVETIKNVLNYNNNTTNDTTNDTTNYDLINIINNQNNQIQELINKINILENRISVIERAF